METWTQRQEAGRKESAQKQGRPGDRRYARIVVKVKVTSTSAQLWQPKVFVVNKPARADANSVVCYQNASGRKWKLLEDSRLPYKLNPFVQLIPRFLLVGHLFQNVFP